MTWLLWFTWRYQPVNRSISVSQSAFFFFFFFFFFFGPEQLIFFFVFVVVLPFLLLFLLLLCLIFIFVLSWNKMYLAKSSRASREQTPGNKSQLIRPPIRWLGVRGLTQIDSQLTRPPIRWLGVRGLTQIDRQLTRPPMTWTRRNIMPIWSSPPFFPVMS